MRSYRLSVGILLAAASTAAMLVASPVAAQSVSDRNLSQVSAQVSSSCSVVTIEFNIRVQVVSYFPQTSGRELHIRIRPLDNAVLGRESLRPPQAVSALRSIEFDGEGGGGPTLSLFFSRDVQFDVAPGDQPQTVVISLSEPGAACAGGPAEPAQPQAPVTPAGGQPAPATVPALPAIAVPRGLYVVNLTSQPSDTGQFSEAQRAALSGMIVYASRFEREGKTWNRMRAGFFPSRSAAEAAHQKLVSLFPEAWVVAVSAQEREQGIGSRIDFGNAPTSTPVAQPLTEQQKTTIASTMLQVDDALRSGENDRAIVLLTQVLGYPENEATARALELLGLTRERKGHNAHARAEYQEYLSRYPQGEAAERIRQRLLAMDSGSQEATLAGTPKLRAPTRGTAGAGKEWRWGARGSWSQFYFRDESSTRFIDASRVDPTAEVDNSVNLNQLLTSADVTLTGGNDRTQMQLRSSGSYTKNFRTGGSDIKAITALYFDIANQDTNVSARIGRQTRNGNGILGRFDGGFVSWQFKPKLRVNLTAGFPVTTSRQTHIDSDHVFGGVSLDYGNRSDPLKATLYYFDQRSHGLVDRQAIGAELRYLKNRVNGFALMDYDIHFKRLNLGIATLNYSFPDDSSLSLTGDYRHSPMLMTSNALIGQTLPGGVGFIPDLGVLQDYFSASQIERIARANTIVTKSLTVGYSRRLSQKLQTNIDFSLNNTGGSSGTDLVTPGSLPIAAMPSVGTEYYYGLQLVGNGLLFQNDIYILGGRFADTQRARTYTFDLNARVPVTTSVRVSPRVRYAMRDDKQLDSSFRQLQPTLRVNIYPRRGSEVELELGGNFTRQRTSIGGVDTKTTERGFLITAGYRLDF